jgi:two-component system CheB/CheR fusion protein
LAREQLEPYAADNPERITIKGEPVSLPAGLATPFSLVLHELATNAAKYGSLSQPNGRVALSWTIVSRNDRLLLRLVWREKGGPSAEQPLETGFGSMLIDNALPRATVSRVFRPEGFMCTIEVSLSEGKENDAGS